MPKDEKCIAGTTTGHDAQGIPLPCPLKPMAVYAKGLAGKPPTEWEYVDPGNTAAIAAVVADGFAIPWGCQGNSVNTARRTTDALLSAEDSSTSLSSGCSSEVMKPMVNACAVIAQAKAKSNPEETPCAQMERQSNELTERLAVLANENEKVEALRELNPYTWFQRVITAVGKAAGTSTEMKQSLQNTLSITIDSNQSQQSQQMCLNNQKTVQHNVVDLTACPNPFVPLYRELCPPEPCPWNQERVTESVPLILQPKHGVTRTTCKPIEPPPREGGDRAKFLAAQWERAVNVRRACLATPYYGKQSTELLNASKGFLRDRMKVKEDIIINNTAQANTTQICDQNVEQAQVSNQAAGIMNEIAQQLDQKSKGWAASSKGEQKTSNCADANVNSCQAATSQACCSNTTSSDQTNTVRMQLGCSSGIRNITNMLRDDKEQLCTQGATQQQENAQTADISNKLTQKATQTSIGMDPMIIFIIFAIVIGLLVLSPIGLVFFLGSKIRFIIIIIGIILKIGRASCRERV